MVTFGKKLSSAIAVACVWVGGSALVQVFFLALFKAMERLQRLQGTEKSALLWFAVAAPIVVSLGGTGAVWVLRWTSGWPKLSLPGLFLRALCVTVFALALIPLKRPMIVHLAAGFLGIAAAMSLTWREASRGSLGTRLFPGSARVPPEEEESAES